MRKVMCPILNKEIDGDRECFDISMVAEDNSPERFAIKEATEVKDYKKICLKCPNHIRE